jgi:hypothetical protein
VIKRLSGFKVAIDDDVNVVLDVDEMDCDEVGWKILGWCNEKKA